MSKKFAKLRFFFKKINTCLYLATNLVGCISFTQNRILYSFLSFVNINIIIFKYCIYNFSMKLIAKLKNQHFITSVTDPKVDPGGLL